MSAFYELDPALKEALELRSEAVRILLQIRDDGDGWIDMPDDALDEAEFSSIRNALGGVCSTAVISFTDDESRLTGLAGRNREIRIIFGCGETGITLHRFSMRCDYRGFSTSRRGKQQIYTAYLEDGPARIRRLGALRNWEEAQIVTDTVLSDKSRPESSLFHLIAARAGIEAEETDCCSVELPLVYAKLSGEPWDDLCALASSCRALIEGGTDRELLFSFSPYQNGGYDEEAGELSEDLFYSLEVREAGESYANSIRLKWNRPERLERQLLWEYEETPAVYDAEMTPSYPFLPDGNRTIQDAEIPMEAPFEVREEHKRLAVLFADENDDEAVVAASLDYEADDGEPGGLELSYYSAESQRALVSVSCSRAGSLKALEIWGRPIVMRSGTACYLSDENEIASQGLSIRLGESRFFSDAEVTGEDGTDRPHPEDWVRRELSQRIRPRRRYTGRSELGLFYIRCGALCRLALEDETALCRIEEFVMSYKRDSGLESRVVLLEE